MSGSDEHGQEVDQPVVCDNCEEELDQILFLTDDPKQCTESEVICDHCGELTGTTVAEAHRRAVS